MDERVDIVTEHGEATGKTVLKSEAHQNGLFHNTVHVWFYTNRGELLFQKRAKGKLVFPSLWDVSVAGHVASGESINTSAIREVQEEIGVVITETQLQKLGVFRSVQKHSETLVDCEFHHTFLVKLTIELEHLVKQESEVDELALWSIDILEHKLKHRKTAETIVPHTQEYFRTIIDAVKRLLQ
ncbi:MAG: NUDIX domain-containing protein [Maribacter sp.]